VPTIQYSTRITQPSVFNSILPLLLLLTHTLQTTVTSVNSGTSPWLRDLMRLCQRSLKYLGRFLVRSVLVSREFELIPTVKMDTRHPIEASFGNEFPPIYNRCEVMAV